MINEIAKRNQDLRSIRDLRARKSMTDGKGWTDKLLDDLKAGIEPAKKQPKRKGRRFRDNASRLTNISL